MNTTVSNPDTRTSRRKTRRIVVPQQAKWHGKLAAAVAHMLLKLLAATLRFDVKDSSGLAEAKSRQVIFCVWHNRLALALILYRRYVRAGNGTRKLAALVSASRDGGMLAKILEHFEAQPVRGSTSKRAHQAMLELTTWAERGYDLALTPDGPRGPCYVVQRGVMSLAQLTGLPIIPVSYRLSWKIRIKSWDRFQVPLPFARCEVHLGAPIHVKRDATDEERNELRQQLENTLKAMTAD